MSSVRSKSKLILERVKDQHTSHWDLDLLSWDELEAALGDPDSAMTAPAADSTSVPGEVDRDSRS